MKRITILFTLCLLMPMMGLAQDDESDFDLELINVQIISEIVDGHPGTSVISPDGTMLAYEGADDTNERGICVYNFEIVDTTCTPYLQETPEGERIRLGRPMSLQWSPDNTMIAIEASSLIYVEDGDIWIFDVVERKFINLTDDGYEGRLDFNGETDGLPIDLLSVWSPTGDLYFIRYIDNGEDVSTELFVIRKNSGSFVGVIGDDESGFADEPELIADLTSTQDDIFSFYNTNFGFSLEGGASVSPDETQIALLFRPRERENSGIWIVDLQSGDITHQISMSQELYATSLPEWVQLGGYIPDGVSWSDENTLVVNGVNFDFVGEIGWTAFTLDLTTETFTPIFDFTEIPSAADYFSSDSNYDSPRMGTLSPDGSHLIFSQSPDLNNGTLSTIPVTGGESFDVYIFDEGEYNVVPAHFASSGNNGEIARMLVSGYIYTFRMME